MVLDAIEMARRLRGNASQSLRCHSDAGSQVMSTRYSECLAEIVDRDPRRHSYDNALAETVNGCYIAVDLHAGRSGPSTLSK
jgi:transposase InsO family protein